MAMFERPQPDLGTEGDVLLARIVAVIIDGVLLTIGIGILVFVLGMLSDVLATLGSLLAVVVFFGYYIYFEGTYGQTIGKMVMDIVVITEDGEPCDMRAAALRTVLRIVDGIFYYLVGLIVILVMDRNQRLGDIVADTVVVRAREPVDEL